MKDTIKRDFIQNRKIVFEVRFTANPRVMDERGNLIDRLVKSNIITNAHWEIGGANLTVTDSLEPNQSRKRIFVDINRVSFISTLGDSNESYISSFEKIFKILKEALGEIDIRRIGCRIQGTYNCESKEYDLIINKFKNHFPNQFLLADYPAQDLRFQLVYQNGMYQIGPIRKDDNFLKSEFPYNERINHIGFAIDTDNYILKENASEQIKESSIKDVFVTSLSVEKSLFENLKSL